MEGDLLKYIAVVLLVVVSYIDVSAGTYYGSPQAPIAPRQPALPNIYGIISSFLPRGPFPPNLPKLPVRSVDEFPPIKRRIPRRRVFNRRTHIRPVNQFRGQPQPASPNLVGPTVQNSLPPTNLGGQQTNGQAVELIRRELITMMQRNPEFIADWVQLGFHSCTGMGGCNGCIDVRDTNNRGLISTYQQVRDLHRRHANDITLADLVALCATEAANEGIRRAGKRARVPFRIGRQTCSNPDMPNKQARFPQGHDPRGMDMLMREFGLSRNESVALMGAHSLGRTNPRTSGFSGPWDNTPNALDNGYWNSLMSTDWQITPSQGGSTQLSANPRDPNSRMMLLADYRIRKDFHTVGPRNEPSCRVLSQCRDARESGLAHAFALNEDLFHLMFISAYEKMLSNGQQQFLRLI